MKKEKEVCFVYSHKFKGEFYVKVEDFKEVIERLISIREENKKLKETIKDHQLYEEKLEHRIIELEELLHGE